MGKLSNSSGEFLRRHHLDQSSIIRGFAALMLSAGTGLGVIYVNYHSYWKVTIYRTQTVDFNILANLLPAKVSTHLLKKDKKGLQEALDTNYGLFGIFVTDCKSVEVDCPEQKVTYGSKLKIEQISNSKQKLIPEGNYAGAWAKKFTETDTPSQLLKGSDYVILRNPPSIQADWKFNSPRDSKIVLSQQKNVAKIVGRIYFIRGNPPSFLSELEKWLKKPLSGNLVYNAIAGSALVTGLLAWLLSEFFHYRSRKAYQLEIEYERALREATEQVNQANIEKSKAEALALLAQAEAVATAVRLNEVTQAKLQSDENARLARSKAAATALRLNEATQAKLQSDENAHLARSEAAATALRLNATDRQRLEAQRNADFAQAEAAATALWLNEATQAKLQSDANALSAQAEAAATALRLNEATQAKLQSDENALSAQAEAVATALQLNEVTQAKLQSDENARLAKAKAAATALRLNKATQAKSKVDKKSEYLLKSLKDKNASYVKLEQKNKELEIRVSELEASKIDGNLITENTTVECSTVSDALMLVAEKFTILNVWENAYTTASDVNGSSPKRVYTVLEILAKVGDRHFEEANNNGIVYLLNEEGVRCSGESRSTMNEYGDERFFRHRGLSRQMKMHIKVGRQLRIYFYIDTENKKIIIGYCGRHLRTVNDN
ncbi:hypothetical protein [Chamaesiphon sp.]|uniref:hypothetical protein n=1 Tax=Chamaesiphon sp. TaxID=2814140 RepID=UPI0035943419